MHNTLHGWFSAKAAKLYGSAIYSTSTNKEVEVTEVTETDKPVGTWDDLKPIGPVLKYLRPGQNKYLEYYSPNY